MGSDKAIVKAKANRIVRDSFLEAITGVNIDKLVAAKRKATAKVASQGCASTQAALPPPWAFPLPPLLQNAWPTHPPNLHPYPVPYPVPILIPPPPPPPTPPPPPRPPRPPPKLESHSTFAVQPNPTSSAPQKPHVIPVADPAQPELPATFPTQITFVACHHCSICGKPRSAGYHRDHPLVPGQVAVSEPCKKCVRTTRDQPIAHMVNVTETGSERRKARSLPRERTRVVIRERCRSPNRSRSRSRRPSLCSTSPQPHREEDIEHRHVPVRPGVEIRTCSAERFGKEFSIHSAPAWEEQWKYRHDSRTTFTQPLPRAFRQENTLAHQHGETWSYRKKTGEAVPRSQLTHEKPLPYPISEEWATYRRQRSESLSTHPESIQESYMNTTLEVKQDHSQQGEYIGTGPVHCTSSRHKALGIDESEGDEGRFENTGGDREVTSHRRASKSDGVGKEEEKRPIPSHVRHVPFHVRSPEVDELDYKKSRAFIRYDPSRPKVSDVEKPVERVVKKPGAGQSSSVPPQRKDAGEQEDDEEKETEQEGRSVISGLHYVVSRNEHHKGPVHVGGKVLGSFRYVDAYKPPKKLVAPENLFSPDSQALIRLARNYEIRHGAPHDAKSQDCSREGGKPENELQASLPGRSRSKVRFVLPALSGSSSSSRKTFRSNDRFSPPSPDPQTKDKHVEEDSETQKWNEAYRGDRIDPPTSDPRKGKFPAREPGKEQNDQEGKDEWTFSMPGNLLSTHCNASPQVEWSGQYRSLSRSRGHSGYDAYHAYHTLPPSPPPVPSPALFPLDWPHSPAPVNAWHHNPNPGETKTFSERSVVGEGEKEIRWKDSASDRMHINGEAEPKKCIDGADERGCCEHGIWQ